jgi:MinD superfamily P-loop ATPase
VQIAVASGKGGTGKTTVAVSLALSIADKRPLLLDCDVESPNAALFLDIDFKEKRDVVQVIPKVDPDICTYCGRCAEVCQYNAIAVIGHHTLVFPELCHSCGSCFLNCPVGALDKVDEVIGELSSGSIGMMDFAQGKLNIGQAMAVPVIRQLKKWQDIEKQEERPIILDVSPGASCPVVEAIRGAGGVLLVTEPTPFGLHDLKVAVTLARDELSLPVAVIINRDGIGDKGVQDYCRAENIPVVMTIPLERIIAEGLTQGIPLVDIKPEYQLRFAALWDELISMTRRNSIPNN